MYLKKIFPPSLWELDSLSFWRMRGTCGELLAVEIGYGVKVVCSSFQSVQLCM